MNALRFLVVEKVWMRDGRLHFGLEVHHEVDGAATIRFTRGTPS